MASWSGMFCFDWIVSSGAPAECGRAIATGRYIKHSGVCQTILTRVSHFSVIRKWRGAARADKTLVRPYGDKWWRNAELYTFPILGRLSSVVWEIEGIKILEYGHSDPQVPAKPDMEEIGDTRVDRTSC